ncbi:HTH CENPB-type domain-containing protein [Trichonephila clavata]|uniref:HTH CENPB-type domain-containing protein n=1 Tax=Trichonephila clavata TaxID=2740835 RepID=A0A8X6GJ87_TRICU|nr:HTH CENPB-type domain-containing protein [Trichonephila clavata]
MKSSYMLTKHVKKYFLNQLKSIHHLTSMSLKKKECYRLWSFKKKGHLSKWEEDIKKGGNKFDIYSFIDSWTVDRFAEARENFHQVTTRNSQQWALSATMHFEDFEFKASECCVKKFKKEHRTRQ